MRTYVYLACLDHEPPLVSRDEADIAKVRSWVDRRAQLVPLQRECLLDLSDQFFRHTVVFLVDHEHCRIGARTEYGEWIDMGFGTPEQQP